jgi:hypothetical protein
MGVGSLKAENALLRESGMGSASKEVMGERADMPGERCTVMLCALR